MADKNSSGLYYPLTKMNFLVSVDQVTGVAAFTEVTGIDASVDVIEFRQGNSNSLAPVKIQGLVKHGNITLRKLRSHMLHGVVKKNNNNTKKKTRHVFLKDLETNSLKHNHLRRWDSHLRRRRPLPSKKI